MTLSKYERARFYDEPITGCVYYCPEHQKRIDNALSGRLKIDWIKVAPHPRWSALPASRADHHHRPAGDRPREGAGMSEMSRLREVAEAAYSEVVRLCQRDERWRMSIPANPSRDSDLLLGEALAAMPLLLDRLEAAEAKVARCEALADEQADECYSPGVHTKCKGHALRRALSAPQSADAPEGHGDADEAGEVEW